MHSIFTWIRECLVRLYFDNRDWASLRDESHRDDIREARIVFGQVIKKVLENGGSQLQISEPARSDLNWIKNRQKRRTELVEYFSQILMDTDNENRSAMFIKKTSLKYSINEVKISLLSAAKFINPANENEANAISTVYASTAFVLSDIDFNKEKKRCLAMRHIINQPVSTISIEDFDAFMKASSSSPIAPVDPNELALNIQEVRKVTSALSNEIIAQKLHKKEDPFV